MKLTITSKTILATTAAIAVALTISGFAVKNDDSSEMTVKLEDCPVAVQQALLDGAAGGKIVEVEKDTRKDGTVVYEAEVKRADGSEVDIEVSEDGKLVNVDADDEDSEDDDD